MKKITLSLVALFLLTLIFSGTAPSAKADTAVAGPSCTQTPGGSDTL